MLETITTAFHTLVEHVGLGLWAMGVFLAGLLLAFPVVRYEVKSLLVFSQWILRLSRKYLRPEVSAFYLCLFIFGFNSIAIFIYMMSGGLLVLPILFDLLTGLNVGAIILLDAQEPTEPLPGPPGEMPEPRAWVGFFTLFVILVELSSFWVSIGMGMGLGRMMGRSFTWETFVREAGPRATAYLVLVVPALLLSAIAETTAIKAVMANPPEPEGTDEASAQERE